MSEKIKQFLKNYYADLTNPFSPILQTSLNFKLRNELNLLSKTMPTVKWLLFVLDRRCRHYSSVVYADQIVELCSLIGIETPEELVSFDLSKIQIEELINWIDPDFSDIKKGKEVNASWIQQKIESSGFILEKSCQWQFNDRVYYTVPLNSLNFIISKSPVYLLPYQPEGRDCDDFAKMFCAFLSYKGHGNLTIGEAFYKAYNKDGKYLFAHAVNLVIVDDNSVYLIEPQTNEKYKPGEIIFQLGGIVEQKIYWIRF